MVGKIKGMLKSIFTDYPSVIRFLAYYVMSMKLHFKYVVKKTKYFLRKIMKSRNAVKPAILQFPITYKCNFDCFMCGMQKMKNRKDMNTADLEYILSNKLFKRIRSVGINGGEPFLIPNIDEYIKILAEELPNLRNISIITDGYLTERILDKLEVIKKQCENRDIKVTVSISLDGVGGVHDKMRGRPNIFSKVENTCRKIAFDKDKYCDNFGIICTITKLNIYYVNEVENWARENGIKVSYNIATVHKRLFNEDRFEDFTVLTDDHAKCLATEWFYCKFRETFSEQYYAIYRYLLDGKRISDCDYKYNGVTLMPDGNIAYCATNSKVLGNGLRYDADKIYYGYQSYKANLLKTCCKSCSHYLGSLTNDAYPEYVKEILDTIGKPSKFRIRAVL